MKLRNLVIGSLILFSCNQDRDVTITEGSVIIENPKVILEIERRGGQLVDLHLKSNPVNPLSWEKAKETMPEQAHENAQFKGHFLCVGSMGKPSEKEMEAGFVWRGEQTGKIWKAEKKNVRKVLMESSSPSDGIEIARIVELHESESQFLVIESFKNFTPRGRATNVFQHVTIGPPFLNEGTLINSNAKSGFYFAYEYPDPYSYEFVFPVAIIDTVSKETIDLRSVSVQKSYLTKHIMDANDEFGWVTAYDPGSGVLLAYVWQKDQYPWLNLWNSSEEGMPLARGLEFGTKGINGSYEQLLRDSISYHGNYSWEYLDAGETTEKSYLVCILDIGMNLDNPDLGFTEDKILVIGEKDNIHGSFSNTLKNR
jgi:hypothetical protein